MTRGFTLLEVLIATVLMVTGVVTLLNMFGIGMFAETEVSRRATALLLAQESQEAARAATYAALNSQASARVALTGIFFGFDREVLVSGDPKQVTVNIYWHAKNDEQQVSLVTLAADYVNP